MRASELLEAQAMRGAEAGPQPGSHNTEYYIPVEDKVERMNL